MIPILLTATIIPNSVYTEYLDINKRKKDYINSINYYKKFSTVYFIENSGYSISDDIDFPRDINIIYITIFNNNSGDWERGKGYQEFRMIDEFVNTFLKENTFIKITGRYIFNNFDILYKQIIKSKKINLNIVLIDLYEKLGKCNSQIFYISKKNYLKYINGCYLDMNDSEGIWAEHVIYNRIKGMDSYYRFDRLPITKVISGSSAKKYRINLLRIILSNLIRSLSNRKTLIY